MPTITVNQSPTSACLEMEGKLDGNRLKALGKFHSIGLLWDRFTYYALQSSSRKQHNNCNRNGIWPMLVRSVGGRLNTIYVRSLIDSISVCKLFQVYLHNNNYYFPQCKSRSREIQIRMRVSETGDQVNKSQIRTFPKSDLCYFYNY